VTIYFGSDDCNFYALNSNGTLKWMYTTDYAIDSSPAIGSNGTLYFGCYDDKLYAIQDPLKVNPSRQGGYYNNTQNIILSINRTETIYYTTNGTTPTINYAKYIAPIIITTTTTLKYLAVDSLGNKSPVYTQTYIIDKIPPKVSSTSPTNNVTGVSLTSSVTIKFSKNIIAGYDYSGIYIKNLSTGNIVLLASKIINGNTLTIKTSYNHLSNDKYQVYIPAGAVKDEAGNNLTVAYTFKFKTV
jgi:hypothetical protein